MAAANSALLLGYICGLIYVGVTGKVAWNFTGGYLGTVKLSEECFAVIDKVFNLVVKLAPQLSS